MTIDLSISIQFVFGFVSFTGIMIILFRQQYKNINELSRAIEKLNESTTNIDRKIIGYAHWRKHVNNEIDCIKGKVTNHSERITKLEKKDLFDEGYDLGKVSK